MEDEEIYHYPGEIKLDEYTISYKAEDIRVIESINENEEKILFVYNNIMWGENYTEFMIKPSREGIIINNLGSEYFKQDGKNIEIIF